MTFKFQDFLLTAILQDDLGKMVPECLDFIAAKDDGGGER